MKKFLCVFFIIQFSSQSFAQKPELVVQQGHASWIKYMDFSRDGKQLLTEGLRDREVRTWEVLTGRLLKTTYNIAGNIHSSINGSKKIEHAYPSDNMAISPSGNVTIFSYQDRVVIRQRDSKDSLVFFCTSEDVTFSNDGSLVAFCTSVEDKAHKAWVEKTIVVNVNRNVKVAEFTGGTCCAISPDKKFIVNFQPKHVRNSFNCDTTLSIWNIDEQKLEKIINLPRHEPIECVSWSPDGSLIATASAYLNSGSGTVVMYQATTGKELYGIKKENEYAGTFVIDRANTMVVASINDTSITIWNMKASKQVFTLPARNMVVGRPRYHILFSPDGQLMVRGKEMYREDLDDPLYNCKAGKSWLYETGTGMKVCDLPNTDIPFSFSEDGKYLAGRSGVKSLNIWNTEKRSLRTSLTTSLKDVKCTKKMESNGLGKLNWSPSGKYLSAGYGEETFWNIALKKEFSVIDQPGYFDTYYVSDEKLIVAAKTYGSVMNVLVTNMDTKKIVNEYTRQGTNGYFIKSALSHDEKYVMAVADSIVILSVPSIKPVAVLECPVSMSDIMEVGFAQNSEVCAAVCADGPVRFWNTTSGKLTATLYFFGNKDWAIVGSDGRFDGTTDGFNRLHFVQNNHAFPLESFFEQFYTPNLLAQVLSGEQIAMAQKSVININNSIKLPPSVTVKSPKTGDTFTTDQLTVEVEATDEGGGVDEIRLFQNGKLVSEETRGMKRTESSGEKISQNYPVTLLPGTNTFRATAFNHDRTEAIPFELVVELKSAIATSNLYILAIGINEYKNGKYNLNYGKPDAQAFVTALEKQGSTIFNNIHKTELYDALATRQNIESAFQTVARNSLPSDAFIFYYAGHGVMSEGSATTLSDFYLIPYDVTRMYGNDRMLDEKGFSAKLLKTLCAQTKAQKQLIVLDACQSGGAVETFASRGVAEEKAILQLARSAGVVVLAATGTEQFATEFQQLGHGVFTYAILKALAGGADGSPKDGKITVKELESYINDQVPELTKKYRGTSQYPNSYARGQDYPLGIVK